MIPAILIIGFILAVIDWNTGGHFSRIPTIRLIFGVIGIVTILVALFN